MGRSKQIQCKRGHELSGNNVWVGKHGRQCRACKRLWHTRKVSSDEGREYVKTKQQRNYLHRKYGISTEHFLEILKEQNHQCKICLDTIENKPCLDHDHTTGRIRSVLCNKCNTAIGLLKEDTEVLRRAISYLEEHGAGPIIGV